MGSLGDEPLEAPGLGTGQQTAPGPPQPQTCLPTALCPRSKYRQGSGSSAKAGFQGRACWADMQAGVTLPWGCTSSSLQWLLLWGVWASVVVVQAFGCSEACVIFPDQGSNLCPLLWQVDSYPLYHQKSSLMILLLTLMSQN